MPAVLHRRSVRAVAVVGGLLAVSLLSATTTLVLVALLCVLVAGTGSWWLALRLTWAPHVRPSAVVGRCAVALGWTVLPFTLPGPGVAVELWAGVVVVATAAWTADLVRRSTAAA